MCSCGGRGGGGGGEYNFAIAFCSSGVSKEVFLAGGGGGLRRGGGKAETLFGLEAAGRITGGGEYVLTPPHQPPDAYPRYKSVTDSYAFSRNVRNQTTKKASNWAQEELLPHHGAQACRRTPQSFSEDLDSGRM